MKIIRLSTTGVTTIIQMEDDPDFSWYAKQIGCDWIEIVRPRNCPYVLIVDEEGLLKENKINPLASDMYGYFEHGQPIVGDCLLMKEEFLEEPTLVGFDYRDAIEIALELNKKLDDIVKKYRRKWNEQGIRDRSNGSGFKVP